MKRNLLVLLVAACAAGAAETPGPLREWLQGVAMRQLQARAAEVGRISTRAQAEERGRKVRQTLIRLMGGLPQERTPLAVRKTGVIDRGDYRVEKLIYESLPKFYVTANLYVPQTGRGPFPAVLQPTGHSAAAKSRAFYQTLALGLVKSGFVVLTYDPLGQGERRLFYDPALGDSKVGGTTVEHQMVGIQSLLAGESIARYMVWDGIRGIDLLAARPEVDARHIGVSGCSGGGTLTAYLAAIDDRLQAAAPACYISAWEEQLPGTGPQDAEQQFPDQLRDGLDHADFATAFAPRPYLQVNTEEDFFPIAGARRAQEESKRIYALYNAADRIGWAVGPGGHGMPVVVREAIYGWMNHWLKGGPAGSLPEPTFQTEFEDDLLCTPTGQVSTSLGGETASTLNIRRYAQKQPAKAPDLKALRAEIQRLTRYEAPTGTVRIQSGSTTRREGYGVQRLSFDAPGGRTVPALLALPENPKGKPVLLISDAGAASALRPGGDADAAVRAGHPVLAVDLAGFGTTNAKWASYADDWFGPDKLAWMAMMTGKPLVGLGIEDVLRALDVLAARQLLGSGAIGLARGIAGVTMMHAAALDKRLSEVVIDGGLLSYAAVARTPIHRRIMAGVVPGVLGRYDLPDLAASIAPRPLTLVDMRMPSGQRALVKDVRQEYRYGVARIRREGETLSVAR